MQKSSNHFRSYGYQTFLRELRLNQRQVKLVHLAFKLALISSTDSRECDRPMVVYKSAINAMRKLAKKDSAIPLLGDGDADLLRDAISKLRDKPHEATAFAEYAIWANKQHDAAMNFLVFDLHGIDYTF